jgi:hypothetical protein
VQTLQMPPDAALAAPVKPSDPPPPV